MLPQRCAKHNRSGSQVTERRIEDDVGYVTKLHAVRIKRRRVFFAEEINAFRVKCTGTRDEYTEREKGGEGESRDTITVSLMNLMHGMFISDVRCTKLLLMRM